MANGRFLFDQDNSYVVPFWYSNDSNELCFKHYRDEVKIPKRYRDIAIYIEKKLYIKKNESCKFLEQDITIKFPDDWTPYLVYPKDISYKKLKSVVVPIFTFSICYSGEDAINNPSKFLKENGYSTMGMCHLKFQYYNTLCSGEVYEDDSLVDEEIEYFDEMFELKDVDLLEFSICLLSVLSVMGKNATAFDIRTLVTMMHDPHRSMWPGLVDINHISDDLLQALADSVRVFPFLPKKYMKFATEGLRSVLSIAYNRISRIANFLDQK